MHAPYVRHVQGERAQPSAHLSAAAQCVQLVEEDDGAAQRLGRLRTAPSSRHTSARACAAARLQVLLFISVQGEQQQRPLMQVLAFPACQKAKR